MYAFVSANKYVQMYNGVLKMAEDKQLTLRLDKKVYDKITELSYIYNQGNRTAYLRDRIQCVHIKDLARVINNYEPLQACAVIREIITKVLGESL